MVFDVGRAMQGLDASRPSLASRALGVDTAWQRLAKHPLQQSQELLDRLSGSGNIAGSGYGQMMRSIAALNRPAGLTMGNKWAAAGFINPVGSHKLASTSSMLNPLLSGPRISTLGTPLASEIFKSISTLQHRHPATRLLSLAEPWSLPPKLASLTRPRIGTAPWLDGLTSNVALATSVAESFRFRGLDGFHGSAWSLHRAWLGSNPALSAILKNTTAFGPIVVRPDLEDDAPFDYHPDLRDILPDTGAEPEEDFDLEEWWAEVVAFAQGVAYHHRRAVLLGVTKSGRVVFQVINHPVTRTAAAGTLFGYFGHEIGGAAGAMFTGGVLPIIVYFLTRR